MEIEEKLYLNSCKFAPGGKFFKKHNEYNFISDLLFATIYNIEKYPPRAQQFKKDVLSKRDNPKEYYKALIEFACL